MLDATKVIKTKGIFLNGCDEERVYGDNCDSSIFNNVLLLCDFYDITKKMIIEIEGNTKQKYFIHIVY